MPKQKIIFFLFVIIAIGAGIVLFSDNLYPENSGMYPERNIFPDEHGCISSAGYAWCEAKNECLRVFEEFCPDQMAGLIEIINSEIETKLTGPESTIFEWRVDNGDSVTTTQVSGADYSADDMKMADYNKIEKYFNDNFQQDLNNMADGVVGGLRGYAGPYFVCALNFKHNKMEATAEGPLVPIGDSLKVSLSCGF